MLGKGRVLATFNVASGVLWEQVDAKTMLIDSASSELVTLNPVGSVVWQSLAAQPMTIPALAEIVAEAFPDVSLEQAAADVETFVAELARLGFLSSVG